MIFFKKLYASKIQSEHWSLIPRYPNVNSWTPEELETFKKQLKQVIWWTEILAENVDPEKESCGEVFRKTRPELDGTPLYHIDGGYTTWNLDTYSHDNYDRLLPLAMEKRTSGFEYDLKHLREFGRILSFQTASTTHDGVVVIESNLFMDESDVPPIDTWFFLKRNYLHSGYYCDQVLFCWIPKKFEAFVQQGIDVEILDSYRWLDENDPIAYNYLTHA